MKDMSINQSSCSLLGVALGCLVLSACGAEDPADFAGGEAEVGEVQGELLNGKPPNGLGDGGAVRIDFWNGTRWRFLCSGQVVASNAILTAAHCLRVVDRPTGLWFFKIWRQNPNLSWSNLTQTANNAGWMVGTNNIHPQYGGVQVPAGSPGCPGTTPCWQNHSARSDVAVIRLDTNLTGINSSDTTYLDNDVQLSRNAQFWGYSTGVLQQGPYRVNPDFNTGQYWSSPQVTDPRVCFGDSGGPLKRAESLFENDGIQIGIGSTISGACLAPGTVTFFTGVKANLSFITGALPGRCTDVSGLSTIGTVRVKRCW